eukprot:13963148-Alexandrium_andersonii.AAC.1
MSASLVGSEMCIRDSAGAYAKSWSPKLPRAAFRDLPTRVGLERARGRETVSYTHLTLPTICSV